MNIKYLYIGVNALKQLLALFDFIAEISKVSNLLLRSRLLIVLTQKELSYSNVLPKVISIALVGLLAGCGGGLSGDTSTLADSGFLIGGQVNGLSGILVLQNNGGDSLTITQSGTFVFATPLAKNSAYSVTVLSQPAGQTCSVSSAAGTVIGMNVNSVAVTCSSITYKVSGTLSGLGSSQVILQNNGVDNLSLTSNGGFTFATPLAAGSAYNVSVFAQPTDRKCSVKNNSGSMESNIINIAVVCGRLNAGAVQGNPLNLASKVSTFAGVAGMYKDGVGAAARFNNLNAIVSDGKNLYVADWGNNAIRKIVIATGLVTTLAGSPTGQQGAADGIGSAASFNGPAFPVIVGSSLFVSDSNNNKIRKIDIGTGQVSSFTGISNTQMLPGASDGSGSAATFTVPLGLTSDGTYLYVADAFNFKVRKILIATAEVSSLTGTPNAQMSAGATDGSATNATFNYMNGITLVGQALYLADYSNNKIRKINIATGDVSSFTGSPNVPTLAGAQDGLAANASFNGPYGITSDGTYLYIADLLNQKIRRIEIATGIVSSVTGVANAAAVAGKLNGSIGTALFNDPGGIAYDSNSNSLFVTEQINNDIRQISQRGVSTLAGPLGPDGSGVAATFNNPQGITTDGTNLYVVDTGNNTIRQIVISTGAVTTLAGQIGNAGATDGPGSLATFNSPQGITTDGTNLYVVDTGNNTIRQIVISTGVATTVAGQAGFTGTTDGRGSAAAFANPVAITTDGINLFVSDTGNNTIRQIVISTGAVTTLAGQAGVTGTTDGTGGSATFNTPAGITTDGTKLYVSDQINNAVRAIQ